MVCKQHPQRISVDCYCVILPAVSAAGNVLTCNLTLANTGNVRLSNITAGGHALGCGMQHPALLWPGTSFVCTLSRFIIQDDFELGNVDLNFPVAASALGLISTLINPQPAVVHNVKLPQRPTLDLITSIEPNFVTWPGRLRPFPGLLLRMVLEHCTMCV